MNSRDETFATQPGPRPKAWSALLLGVSLVCISIGLLQRPPTLTDASQGLLSELARLLPFALTGFVAARQRRPMTFLISWVAVLNLIDKGAIAVGVALFVVGIDLPRLAEGAFLIWLITLPLALVVCGVFYVLADLTSASGRSDLSHWARLMALAGLVAVLVPIVHAVNGYALLSIYDVPLFALSSSYRLVPVLQVAFMAIGTIALISYAVGTISTRKITSASIAATGALLLIASALMFIALDSSSLLSS